jgi:hypothetical protein
MYIYIVVVVEDISLFSVVWSIITVVELVSSVLVVEVVSLVVVVGSIAGDVEVISDVVSTFTEHVTFQVRFKS